MDKDTPKQNDHAIGASPENLTQDDRRERQEYNEENCSPEPHHYSGTDTTSSTTPSSGTGSAGGSGSPGRGHHHQVSGPKIPGSLPPTEEWMSSDYGHPPPATSDEATGMHHKYERSNSGSFAFAVKMLVSNNVAGSIIGRSGQTISELQAQSGTRIKLSQTGDYYPGTQDRVCLIQGDSENVKTATKLIISRLHALQKQQHSHHNPTWQGKHQREATEEGISSSLSAVAAVGKSTAPAFAFIVKLLVPSPCCGMLIGKSGSNIKRMVDASGVSSIRLAPKQGGNSDYSLRGATAAAAAAMVSATAERVVTITGPELNCCVKCMSMILDGMTAHPDICRYANMTTSYSRVLSAAHGALGAAQAAALAAAQASAAAPSATTPARRSQMSEPMSMSSMRSGMDVGSMGLWDPQITPAPVGTGFPSSPSMFSSAPSSAGAPSPQQRAELSAYSPVFGIPASSSASGSYLSQSMDSSIQNPSPTRHVQPPSYLVTPTFQRGTTPSWSVSSEGGGHYSSAPISASNSAPDLLALHLQDSARISDLQPPPLLPTGMMDSNAPASRVVSGPSPATTPTTPRHQQSYTAQVAIPDSLIGSILGRGGRTLNDLQVLSNTRIRISQRNEFVPGTKNRIVTIRGPTAQSVAAAQSLMSQRMIIPPTAAVSESSPTAPQAPSVIPLQSMTSDTQEASEMTPASSSSPQTSSTTPSSMHESKTTSRDHQPPPP